MKKSIMKRAWEIYKTLEGDRIAKLALALRMAWEEAKEDKVAKKTKATAVKKFTASVINKETKKEEVITMEYPTKKEFAQDIRGNGYYVRFISTPDKFDEDCEKYHQRLEMQKIKQRAIREVRKAFPVV